jgi:hypothetical protein
MHRTARRWARRSHTCREVGIDWRSWLVADNYMVLVVEVGEEYRAEAKAPVRQRNIHGDVEVLALGGRPVLFESR